MASGRIKGITIEIGGDTTKLQKSLSSVDKSLRNTQTNLRDVNKLLKLNPKNTELLTQKQKLLKEAIGETRERLQKLKEAQSQVKRGTDDWDALQREIIETETNLQKLETEYKDFGSVAKQQLEAVKKKIEGVSSKLKDVGGKLTKSITGPIVALGAGTVAAFKSVDEGFDTIIKKTGASGEAAEEMRGIMENLATQIPTDFETAGAAIGEVNTRFGVTGDELEDLSARFIKFADLNEVDVSTAIDSVQAAMAAFNVSTQDTATVLDIINKAAQDTGVSVDQLTQNILTNAPALVEMGLNFETAVGLLANFEKSGVDSGTMLVGFKTALKNATKEGIPLEEAIASLAKEFKLAGSDTEAAQAAMELFGNKAGPAIAKAVSEGKLNLEDLATGVEGFGGSVENTFNTTLDPIDKFTTTLNGLKILGAEIGGSVLEIVTPAVQTLATVIQGLKEKWDGLSPETQDMIIKAAMIAAAIGPIVTLAGALAGAIGALISPIGLVIGAIAGAIAIGVALYKNWDTIKEKAKEIKEAVVEKWNGLKEDVGAAVETLKTKVSTQWEKVTSATETVKTSVSTAWETAKTRVSNAVSGMAQTASEKMESMRSTLTEKAASIKQNVSEKFSSLRSSVSTTFTNIWGTASSIFKSIYNTITGKIGDARDFVKRAIEKIKGFFDFSWSLPDIKLPHFSIEGSFSLSPPSIPHISVDWYKKAYNNPYLFTSPTVISGKGFGDGGGSGEIVYGRDQLMRDIAAAQGGDEITVNIYASEGMDTNALADKVIQKLSLAQRQRARVYA